MSTRLPEPASYSEHPAHGDVQHHMGKAAGIWAKGVDGMEGLLACLLGKMTQVTCRYAK